MSELKSKLLGQTMNEYGCDTKIYIKSEADKVIAELKNEVETQKRLRDMALASVPNALKVMKIIQHQKYKRCLDNAEICCEKKENCYNRALRKYSKDEADYLFRKSDFWQDWEFRWLKIVEKFKPNKSTAQ